jgi:predicted nucleotidyltransferase
MSTLTLSDVRHIAQASAKEHGVREMYVYGSVSRGDADSESDVDFVYQLEKGQKATAGVILSLKESLERGFGKPVSLLSMRVLKLNAEHSKSGKMFYDSIRPDLKRVV